MKIIDIIDHRNKYKTRRFVVINRKPKYLYERKGIWLIGEDSGFFNFYYHQAPSGRFYAFCGRKFDIPLKDGSIEKAFGQWWYGIPSGYSDLIYRLGCGTPEALGRCNVFCSAAVDRAIIDKWLSENEPSNNYHKYDNRHSDFGKHVIKSRWENVEGGGKP